MKRWILVVVSLPLLLLGAAAHPQRAHAYQPGAHYALITDLRTNLPAGSPFKKAIATYPAYAAWGSVGPDLPPVDYDFLIGRVPWFDTTHYQQNGQYARYLLQTAMAEPDPDKRLRLEAFAAGYFSHVVGDMAIHGLLVNPECGIGMSSTDKETTRHHLLEGYADAYTWVHLANNGKGYPKDWLAPYVSTADNSNKLYTHFGEIGNEAGALVEKANNEVIRKGQRYTFLNAEFFGAEEFGDCVEKMRRVIAGKDDLADYVGSEAKMFRDLAESEARLDEFGYNRAFNQAIDQTRETRVINAWYQANAYALEGLKEAAAGNWTGPVWKSSDAWMADAGINDGRGIGAIQVVFETGDKNYSWLDGGGTDCDIWLKLEFEQGDQRYTAMFPCYWTHNKDIAYNDFEEGDRDVYYLPYDGPLPIWTLKRLTIPMYADLWAQANSPVWDFKQIELRANHRVVYRSEYADHLTAYDKAFRTVSWPGIAPQSIWPGFQTGVMPTEPSPEFSMPDPLTSLALKNVTVRKGRTARLPFTVLNGTKRCDPVAVTVTISRQGRVVKRARLADVASNRSARYTFRVKLPAGKYKWKVRAVDVDGSFSVSQERSLVVR